MEKTPNKKINWEKEYPLNTFTQETREEIMEVLERAVEENQKENNKLIMQIEKIHTDEILELLDNKKYEKTKK